MPDAIVYDSAIARRSVLRQPRLIWHYRGLLRLLVERNLTVRYKRSILGVWWTLLNPFLLTLVMWLVFSQVFRFPTPGVPYIVYLLSGVLVATQFAQGMTQVPMSIVQNSGVLTKVNAPPEVFALAAGGMGYVNLLLGVLPLLGIQLLTGVGIPWTAALVPLAGLFTALLVFGLGLLVASLAVYFFDVFDLAAVGIQIVTYATPVFYPIGIVPDRFLGFIHANPLFAHLEVFRSLAYEGVMPPAGALAYGVISALVAAVAGIAAFNRSWKNLVVLL